MPYEYTDRTRTTLVAVAGMSITFLAIACQAPDAVSPRALPVAELARSVVTPPEQISHTGHASGGSDHSVAISSERVLWIDRSRLITLVNSNGVSFLYRPTDLQLYDGALGTSSLVFAGDASRHVDDVAISGNLLAWTEREVHPTPGNQRLYMMDVAVGGTPTLVSATAGRPKLAGNRLAFKTSSADLYVLDTSTGVTTFIATSVGSYDIDGSIVCWFRVDSDDRIRWVDLSASVPTTNTLGVAPALGAIEVAVSDNLFLFNGPAGEVVYAADRFSGEVWEVARAFSDLANDPDDFHLFARPRISQAYGIWIDHNPHTFENLLRVKNVFRPVESDVISAGLIWGVAIEDKSVAFVAASPDGTDLFLSRIRPGGATGGPPPGRGGAPPP